MAVRGARFEPSRRPHLRHQLIRGHVCGQPSIDSFANSGNSRCQGNAEQPFDTSVKVGYGQTETVLHLEHVIPARCAHFWSDLSIWMVGAVDLDQVKKAMACSELGLVSRVKMERVRSNSSCYVVYSSAGKRWITMKRALIWQTIVSVILAGIVGCQSARTGLYAGREHRTGLSGLTRSSSQNGSMVSSAQRTGGSVGQHPTALDLSQGVEKTPSPLGWSRILGRLSRPMRIPLPRTDLELDESTAIESKSDTPRLVAF